MKKSFIKRYIEYLKDNPERYWFKRKLYGWGWTPATKEGWLVTVLYAAIILTLAFTIDENSTGKEVVFMLFIPLAILTSMFIRIAYKKGEKPKWSWSFPKEVSEDNGEESNAPEQ